MTDIKDIWGTARPYAASFVILRRGDSVAFVLRKNTDWMDGHYGLPAGKLERNESFMVGALREAKEEVGVVIEEADLRHALTVHRKADDDDMDWIDMYFEASKWQGEPHNAEPDVHSELAWLDINNLPKNMVPPVRSALQQIANGQTYAEYGWDT